MSSFVITAHRLEPPNDDDIRRIRIAAGEDVLTRLIRDGCEKDDALRASATPLAFWLVDNWWRIRCEPVPFTGADWQWRMAHELTAIGAGYIWPCVAFWGEGTRVGISVDERETPMRIQFLADGIRYLPADEVESGVDQFIRQMLSEPIVDRAALQTEYDALCAEREDQGARDWRTVEAMLGYDIGEAPDGLMDTLDGLVDEYDQTSIEEAVLARPGEQAADALQTAVEAARTSNIRAHVPAPLKEVTLDREQPIAPWALAEQAAASVRAELCLTGPVGNQALADILGVSCNAIEDKPHPAFPTACAWRTATGSTAAWPSRRPARKPGGSSSAAISATWCGPTTASSAPCPMP